MSGPENVAGPDELRELVREVLRDVLPSLAASAPSPVPDNTGPDNTGPDNTGPDNTGPDNTVQAVRLGTDEELQAFVRHILRLADDPQRRRDILAGRLRFTLGSAGTRPVPALIQRVDKGAVTERTVIAAAAAGARLVLGPRAVLTPLAKDKARALAVLVEKER